MKLKLDAAPDLAAAMREAGLKTAWRGQITGAGLGRRLANSVRSQTCPRAGESLNAAALVWSKAPVIVGAHDTCPLIWLVIPTEAAGRGLRDGVCLSLRLPVTVSLIEGTTDARFCAIDLFEHMTNCLQ